MTRGSAHGSVLVWAPKGRDATVIAGVLGITGIETVITVDAADFIARLDEAGTAVIACEALTGATVSAMTDWIRGQPSWSDLPLIVLIDGPEPGGPPSDDAMPFLDLGNVALVERPCFPQTLRSATRSALRARQRQLQLAAELAEGQQMQEVLRAAEQRFRSDLEQLVRVRTAALEVETAERERAQDALRQAQKMEAVGQLTGGVAHDFNNLLTVIKSSTDLLKRPDLSDERRTRYVAAISDTVDRAAKLTGQLLAFARQQALKPEVFAACDSVRGISDMMRTLTGSRVRITTHLPDLPVFVNADPSQFDTALVNMAVNARDAMDGEGELTVSVHTVDGMPAVRLHPARVGAFVAVTITDTGSGIAPERLERIFEPFFTTKEVGKGTGLGLSQVFGFAKQSGGDVTVESTLGLGTTFTLYLPRVAAEQHVTRATNEPNLLSVGHGTCVLVVEDNLDVGSFAVQSLTDLGYVTVLANNAEEALTELARNADRFDAVFTDVVMPGMNGIELGQEIRRLYHDLPVVLASGYSHVLARNGTYGFELLHKPYSVEELSRLLRKVGTWRSRKESRQSGSISDSAKHHG